MKKVTADDELWIANCLTRGVSMKQLAKDLHISRLTVWRAAKSAGYRRAVGRYPRLPDELRQEIVRHLRAGFSQASIASAYDVDPSVVSMLRLKAGLESTVKSGRKSRHNFKLENPTNV